MFWTPSKVHPQDILADGCCCTCVHRVQMSVDIFCLCSHYTDLASLGPIAHYTCGQVDGCEAHLLWEATATGKPDCSSSAAARCQLGAPQQERFLDAVTAMCAAFAFAACQWTLLTYQICTSARITVRCCTCCCMSPRVRISAGTMQPVTCCHCHLRHAVLLLSLQFHLAIV